MRKVLSTYSYFFTRIRRIQGQFLSVYGEYGEFKVVCSTQNRLRKRGKNLCVHGKDDKKHKTPYISVNNNKKILNFFDYFYLHCSIWDGLSLKIISHYCPFK